MKGIHRWAYIPLLISTFALPIFAFAEGSDVSTVSEVSKAATNGVMAGSGSTQTKTSEITAPDGTNMSDIDGSSYIPDTTIEDANQWVNDKGEDLVGLGGTIAEPLSIIGFMLGLFITLAGAFTRSNHIVKGLLVMAISIVVYVGTVFAPELVQYFSTWLAS